MVMSFEIQRRVKFVDNLMVYAFYVCAGYS